MYGVFGANGSRAMDGVPDMTILSDLDEDAINLNLKIRYQNDRIYTYSGTILVAVNPYKQLDIYSTEWIQRYQNKKMVDEEPHVFALAESSLRALQTSERNQSCVISGESGAGKTESTKFLLQYLCSVTTGVSTWVEQQILEANTVLEAFGNAKTVRNDNSSRFGKFIQVCFDKSWFIKGCLMQDYLLEQSRITFQGANERNYHVFYQLLAGAEKNAELKEAFHLNHASTYEYLNQGCIAIDGVDDDTRFDALRLAFSVLLISEETCAGIFGTLSAILWLGNLKFIDIDGEKCELSKNDIKIINIVSNLLGLPAQDIEEIVLQRQINIRGTITHIPFKIEEARENRHAMAKALYSRTFAWLVDHINKCTNPGNDQKRFLGVLDIFGFENFDTNSFEQLCINYTNEKLHKFFNHYVFALEQEIYKQEEIKFKHIEFTDNTICLELLEKPPTCILKLISEECRMPKGTDQSYLRKMHQEFECHQNYIKGDDRRRWEHEFGIIHYAGKVIYTVSGFVDKNRDAQQDVFFNLMIKSKSKFINDLTQFQDLLSCTVNRMGTMSRGSTKGKPTVSDAFRNQLQALVDVLQSTNPWYVRCIKPNQNKAANSYDEVLVLDQLSYLGMNDIIRIRREGFPIHATFEDFIKRYFCLWHRRRFKDIKMHIGEFVKALKLPWKEWQIGKTKIFIKQKVYDHLEDQRYRMTQKAALKIQTYYRMFRQKKKLQQHRKAAIIIQSKFRSSTQRRWFLRQKRAVIVMQSYVRGMFGREVANALREMKRIEEEEKKKERLDEEKRQKLLAAEMKEKAEKELEEAESQFKKELNTLTDVAQTVNPHMSKKNEEETEVDLDSIFEFLSKVQQNDRHPLDETINDMEDLASKVDEEIELLKSQNQKEEVKKNVVEEEKKIEVTYSPRKLNRKSYPEEQIYDFNRPNGPLVSESPTKRAEKEKHKEPIYETIPIGLRKETKEPSYISGPPPDEPPPAPPAPPDKPDWNESTTLPRHKGHYDKSQLDRKSQYDDAKLQRRKQRIEKKLHEIEEKNEDREDDTHLDMAEFAEKYFNAHEKSIEGTFERLSTLRRKPSAPVELLPKTDLLTYTRTPTIPTSHLKLNDPENVQIACNIFRDLNKFLRGEVKVDQESSIVQSIIGHGIEREELRSEIYIQCMRQATNNPSVESLERLWLLLCLIVVAFQPSKILCKYFYCFLQKSQCLEGKLYQYLQWCAENFKLSRHNRKMPPSSVEIAAMKKLGTIVCRFFFLDGRTKAIDVHPRDTSADAIRKLAERLQLSSIDGWAIYESNDGDRHVKSHQYLYDVISSWEKKQAMSSGTYGTLGKKTQISGGENRFLFRKRLFRNPREIPSDPAEVNLLYAQAVFSVAKNDDYPINEKVALQLAGLQCQVSLGDPQTGKTEFYADIQSYLPDRIAQTRKQTEWVPILAEAHQQYGTGKAEILSKVWYLTCVMQFPLYGTTMFNVSYRGYWSYDNCLILGVNCDGISMIKPDTKVILYEYQYCEIESIFLDPSDNFITFNLLKTLPDVHKCFVFETNEKEEIGLLIGSYAPHLASWFKDVDSCKKAKNITHEDRVRLYYNIVHSRRLVIDSGILRRPLDPGGNFIVSTLRRLNKQKLEKHRQDSSDSSENYKGYTYSFWAFTKFALTQTITRIEDQDLENKSLQIFNMFLTYAGLSTQSEIKIKSDDQQLIIIQNVLEQCMSKDVLLNESYLQLLKQTSDHPDPNSRVNMRHWSLLMLFCSVIPPTDRLVRKYLRAHLQRCSIDFITEEGKYARYAEKCLMKALNNRRRQWPPSRQEILCTINRRPIYSRFHFMDGQFHSLEFEASATSADVIELIKEKVGLTEQAKGYAIYEMLGATERCLNKDDVLADVMSRWDKYRHATSSTGVVPQGHYIFLFKKHLLLDAWMNLGDPVEKELIYFQVLYSLRADKFPVTNTEAIMLCSLRAQIELGNWSNGMDYTEVIEHTLSPRLLNAVTHEAVAAQHQSLFNMDGQEAKESFLTLIRSFPLHRATIFDVTQSFTSNWPKILWLALDEEGVHLLEHRSRNVLCTYEYSYILNYSASVTALMIITGSKRKQSKIILNTTQAFMIATLIRDYSAVVVSKDINRHSGYFTQNVANHQNIMAQTSHNPWRS